MATHLADTSALARLHNQDVFAVLSPMILAGQVATCAFVDLELLQSARDAADHDQLRYDRTMYPRVDCGEMALERAVKVQGLLAERGLHRTVGTVDLVIAAAAEQAGLTLLHYDHDFDLVAHATGQGAEWVVPRGTVP